MKKQMAEFIGTFCLVLFGCGAAAIGGNDTIAKLSGLGLLGISIAFGFAVVVMAYAIGPISGCHINPAITVAMLVAGKIKVGEAVGYIVAQMAGAVAAAAVLYVISKGQAGFELREWALGSNGWGTGYQNEYSTASAFLTEAVFSFIFLFVIFAVTSKIGNPNMAGLAIGLSLVLIHLVAIPVTGTSVNPARSFGPAVFAGGKALSQLWLFFAAPLVGAVLSAFAWKALFEKSSAV